MMQFLRKRRIAVIAVLIVAVVSLAWVLAPRAAAGTEAVVAHVKKGDFRVVVNSAGELRARKFVQITIPPNTQQAEVYQMKIATLVPEGTVVKEGDLVAELDRSTIASKLAEVTLALQKAQAQYEQAQLDSTLNLSKAREDMHTMELGLEEKRIAKEQAVYEAPSVRRQADIDYEKAERALAQAKVDYKTKTEQAQAKMREVGADFERQKNKLKFVQDVMGGFTIKAPAPGMVTYVKEWNGKKKTAGSQVNSWEPAVATLPDLTQMESITYVNEIDVRKISAGNKVKLGLDADPGKQLSGTVKSVANIGEQRPNADAKVFEVIIVVDQADTTLRPGMTTSNGIETTTLKDALSVPLEAVSLEGDVPYVFKKSGSSVIRQEVETGPMNDNEIVIVRGVQADDRVLLSEPADRTGMETVRLPGSKAGQGNVPPVGPSDTPATAKQVPVKPEPAAKAEDKTATAPRPLAVPLPAPKP